MMLIVFSTIAGFDQGMKKAEWAEFKETFLEFINNEDQALKGLLGPFKAIHNALQTRFADQIEKIPARAYLTATYHASLH